LCDLGNGEDAACFVVHEHHRNERGVVPQGVFHLGDGDVAVFVGLQIRDGIALLLECLAGLQNGTVLHSGRDDVLACMTILMKSKANGPVVALRAAGGEDQLLGLAAERRGNCFARSAHSVARIFADGVLRAGIAPAGKERIVNGTCHLCGDGGGGGVIKIDHIGKILSLDLSDRSNDYTIYKEKSKGGNRFVRQKTEKVTA